MKIIVNTSTFKQSSNDPAPNFINKLVEEFSEKNYFYILFPRKTKDVISKSYSKIYPCCPTVIFSKGFIKLIRIWTVPFNKKK